MALWITFHLRLVRQQPLIYGGAYGKGLDPELLLGGKARRSSLPFRALRISAQLGSPACAAWPRKIGRVPNADRLPGEQSSFMASRTTRKTTSSETNWSRSRSLPMNCWNMTSLWSVFNRVLGGPAAGSRRPRVLIRAAGSGKVDEYATRHRLPAGRGSRAPSRFGWSGEILTRVLEMAHGEFEGISDG
jgi:hypothetical protein